MTGISIFLDKRDQFQSVDIRHRDIGDDKGGSVLLEEFQSLLRIISFLNLIFGREGFRD